MPVPIKRKTLRVSNVRANRRKHGPPDRAKWIGRPRTGNAALQKASASSKPRVVERGLGEVDVPAAEPVAGAAAGVDVKHAQALPPYY
jgi:hypothetical protein